MMMLQRQREAEQLTLEKPKEEGQPTSGAPNTANQQQPGVSDQPQPPSGPADEAAAGGAPQNEAKAEADGEEGDEEYDDEAGEGEGEGEEGDEGEEEGEEEAEEEGEEENGQEESNGTNDAAEAEATTAAAGKAKEAKPEESAAVAAASLDEIRFRVKTVCKKAKKAADNRYATDAIEPIGWPT